MDLWMCVRNFLIRNSLWRNLLGFKAGPMTGFSGSCCQCLFFFYFIICIINGKVLRNISERWNLNEKESNESLFIDRCFFFPLTYLSLFTLPINLAQTWQVICLYKYGIFSLIAFILLSYDTFYNGRKLP